MKKLNSIWYGSRILGVCGVFTILIPLLLYIIYSISGKSSVFLLLIKVSIFIGLMILVFFSVLLTIELRQDKSIERKYNELKYRKIQIAPGLYECQYCGCRFAGSTDMYCKTCGVKFSKENNKE